MEGDLERELEGDFKPDMEADMLSSSGLLQVWSRSGIFKIFQGISPSKVGKGKKIFARSV